MIGQAHIAEQEQILNLKTVDRPSFNTANFVAMDETPRLVIGTAATTAEGIFVVNPVTD